MKKIILMPGNSLDLRKEKLESLISELQEQYPDNEVQYKTNELSGYGVTFWEVLYVCLVWTALNITETAIKKFTELFIEWAFNRFIEDDQNKRPKYVAIYGPNGEVLKSVLVKSKDSEPEDYTEEDKKNPRRYPPKFD